MLTHHTVGAKEGSCIVPAVFRGPHRKKDDADAIGIALLDSDSGASLDEISNAISRQGWRAVVSSTHSHMQTTTRVKRTHWDRYSASRRGSTCDAASFLVDEKGYLPRVASGARVIDQNAEYVFFEHRPCPKFRIAVPLLRPWQAADYIDQVSANESWRKRIEALAAGLHLNHDQACTDTSRLFYLPRRPADGPVSEIVVLEGESCDIFALPDATNADSARSSRPRNQTASDEDASFVDPTTGEVFDLRKWARDQAGQFQLVAALKAKKPDIFTGKTVGRKKYHIRCVNEDAHTQAGTDAATFVMNAGDSSNRGFVYHCRHAHCGGRDRLFFLGRMLEQDWLKVADLHDPLFRQQREDARPVIRYVAGDLPSIVDQAEQALLDANFGLFQRGPFIVRPGHVHVAVSHGRKIPSPTILAVGDNLLVEEFTRAANWTKFDGRSNAWVSVDAPIKIAATYRERVGRWRLPVLTGIISAPTLRADGSILAEPGYDWKTGLLLDPGATAFPDIPHKPAEAEARAALAILLDLIKTFPFVTEADRSVALSAVLTACMRRSLGAAPLHAFTAPIAGSGKSLLVDVISVIATGREAPVIAQGGTEQEFEKRLGAALLAGDQTIAIDNCEAPVGGQFLCSVLTQRVVRARILGRSEMPELPAGVFVTATGNNLVLLADMTRRSVLCRLDPKAERPELRQFSFHPIEVVKANRGRYLAAALTVLRAYHVAGRPPQCGSVGSFEEWSDWARAALLWLDQVDPVVTMEAARRRDPKRDALLAVLVQWQQVIGIRTVSVSHVIEYAMRTCKSASEGVTEPLQCEFVCPEFREALLAVAGDDGVINGRRLGKWLAANASRIVRGMRIVQQGERGGVAHWQLELTDSSESSSEQPQGFDGF